nr:cellulase family glycosylhydrolase [uncultured Carboxylicivirga sp.]
MKKILLSLLGLAFIAMSCSDSSSDPAPGQDDDNKVEDPAANIDFTQPIRGVNWADARDNFVDGLLLPSGLTSGDNYYMVQVNAQYIINGFIKNMDANTVRLPINYATVSSSWWNGYKGAIDKAVEKGMRVILAYWEGDSSRDGKVDDAAEFWEMWATVTSDYADNKGVYFEVMNEPHGYSLTELTDLYASWLEEFPTIPHSRILLGGKGWSEDVTGVGADTRFSDCLLSLHNYAFWAERSADEWRTDWLNRIGDYGSRTVVTEFGSTMTQGKDYNSTQEGDNEVDYIQAATAIFREKGVQSVYWPGLRDGDWYSIQTYDPATYTLSTTNQSGLSQIRYGWGFND